MSAINLNNFTMQKKLRILPSKTLLRDYIEARDKGFFDKMSSLSLMSGTDKAISQCRAELATGSFGAVELTREFLIAHIYGIFMKNYEDSLKMSLTLKEVINATGIVLHTNLGRAPIFKEKKSGSSIAAAEISDGGRELDGDPAAAGYCNLEFDVESGKRGKRDEHFKNIIKCLTGAEDVILVNNNAAAVFLIAKTFCGAREIILARGEAVEIGEGFRICEMFNLAGAEIKEVGATNSVYAQDYESAFNEKTAMIAKIHSSNFKIMGFVKSFNALEIPAIAKKHGVISYCDSGSGMIDRKFFNNAKYLDDEYSIRELIAAGFDIVSFSGDKLFGSVQCGIICGRAELISKLRSNQLYRAMRVSKQVINDIAMTAFEYAAGNPRENILTLSLLNNEADNLKKEAEKLLESLKNEEIYNEKITAAKILDIEILPVLSSSGGGSAPMQYLNSYGLVIKRNNATAAEITLESIALFMRTQTPPIVGYIDSDGYVLNFRTLLNHQISKVRSAIIKFLSTL